MAHIQRLTPPTNLPTTFLTSDSIRLKDWLGIIDSRLTQQREINVYGSAAVSFYLADWLDAPYKGETDDIDVWSRGFSQDLVELSPEIHPSLKFSPYQFETWLIHPDWQHSLVDLTAMLGFSNLRVKLLHPLDLVIMKHERWNDRDAEDCYELVTRYALDVTTYAERLETALDFAVGINDIQRKWILDCGQDLFEELS